MIHLNKFVSNAVLKQFYIKISNESIQAQLNVNIENYEILIFYYISNAYNCIAYNDFISTVPSLIPAINSCIEVNNEKIPVKGNIELSSSLFIAGNIKNRNNKICFYGKILELIKPIRKTYIDITLSGIWIKPNKFLNICDNIPILFYIKNEKIDNDRKIKILKLKYNQGFIDTNNLIKYYSDPQLIIKQSFDTYEQIEQSLLTDLITEWEIRNAE